MSRRFKQWQCVSELQYEEDSTEAPSQRPSIIQGERLISSQIRCAPAVDKRIFPIIMHISLWLLLLIFWRVAAYSNEAFRSLCWIFSQASAIPSSQYITGHIQKYTCKRSGGVVFQRVVRLKVSPELSHFPCRLSWSSNDSIRCPHESLYRLRGCLLSAPPWEVLDQLLPPALLPWTLPLRGVQETWVHNHWLIVSPQLDR